jgi:solute carrier family 35 (GDP-fucose transporter), member C1
LNKKMSCSKRSWDIAGVVCLYFVVSILLVFSNKVLLTPGSSIPAPLFVTWFQCVFTFGVIAICGYYGQGAPKDTFWGEFSTPVYNLRVAKAVMPLSIIFVGMITFNNLCLQYVEVSFYNVARSLSIVFNVVFTFLILGEKTSFLTTLTLATVVIGFFVGSDGEINFSFWGTTFGVISSMFVSLNGIYTKKILPAVDKDKWRLAFYNNVNASIMFIPLIILSGEVPIIAQHAHLLVSATYWGIMTIAGFLGFAIGIVTVMQISITSPLTHNISGTAKACVQTLLALVIWQNPTTAQALFGVFLVIFGSMWYTYQRSREMDAPKPAAPPVVDVERGVSRNN